MQAFTDLVGTAVVPTHGFDIDELTELTPALDTTTAAHDTADQASETPTSIELLGSLCLSASCVAAAERPLR